MTLNGLTVLGYDLCNGSFTMRADSVICASSMSMKTFCSSEMTAVVRQFGRKYAYIQLWQCVLAFICLQTTSNCMKRFF